MIKLDLLNILNKGFFERPRFRQYATRLVAGNRDTDVEMLGASFSLHSVKESGYLLASKACKYSHLLRDEVPALINLACLLRDGDTFVDIGANVGLHSLVLHRLGALKKDLRFYAFEANPDTFLRLKKQTHKTDIEAVNIAISNVKGSLDFVGGAVSHVFTVASKANSYSINDNSISVNSERLDQLDIKGSSLVLKIDVEGQELEVIQGAENLLEMGVIRAVYIDGYADKSVETVLAGYGFKFFDGKTLLPVSGNVFSLLAVKD